MTDSRDAILGRVREALRNPTRRPLHEPVSQPEPLPESGARQLPVLSNVRADRQFLPAVGESLEERWDLFCELSAKLRTRCHRVESLAEASRLFGELAQLEGWGSVGVMTHPWVDKVVGDVGERYEVTPETFDKHVLEKCSVGVTTCDALIAQAASVLVSNQSGGGRSLSILPPHHVVIASAAQIVPTIVDGYDVLRARYGDEWPNFISLITGPSRTGDIERVLVLGAHGPKKLDVILVESIE